MDFPFAFVEKVRASAEEVEARAVSEAKIAGYSVNKFVHKVKIFQI